jgi:hypothetical protein
MNSVPVKSKNMGRWVYHGLKRLERRVDKQHPSSVEVKLLPNGVLQGDV